MMAIQHTCEKIIGMLLTIILFNITKPFCVRFAKSLMKTNICSIKLVVSTGNSKGPVLCVSATTLFSRAFFVDNQVQVIVCVPVSGISKPLVYSETK